MAFGTALSITSPAPAAFDQQPCLVVYVCVDCICGVDSGQMFLCRMPSMHSLHHSGRVSYIM